MPVPYLIQNYFTHSGALLNASKSLLSSVMFVKLFNNREPKCKSSEVNIENYKQLFSGLNRNMKRAPNNLQNNSS